MPSRNLPNWGNSKELAPNAKPKCRVLGLGIEFSIVDSSLNTYSGGYVQVELPDWACQNATR